MGRPSRNKGARSEREIANLHASLGVRAERVPLSGAARYRGNGADVDVYAFGQDEAPLVSEVKARGNGEGFVQLERWLGDADALFLRRDRAEPVVVLPWRSWARLLTSPASRLRAPLASIPAEPTDGQTARPGDAPQRPAGARRRRR